MGLLFKNGTILSPTEEYVGDILVEGEIITQVGVDIPEDDHEIVDASGKYVFPGGVDQHVHMGPFDTYSFETSHAALAGGTTTIVDFAPQFKDMGVIESKHKHHKEKAEGVASVDYSFHGMVMDTSDAVLDEIPKMAENGIVNLKFFMAYKGTPFYVEDDLIFKAMQLCREHGITVWVHCENGPMIEVLTQQRVDAGHKDPINHSYARPPLVEDEATKRIIYLAEMADCPLNIVHVTSKGAMHHVREARLKGLPVYGETCTHYLTLDESFLAKENFEGAKYVCAPALRTKDHIEELWHGVREDYLNAVSSDHAAVVGGFETKKKGLDSFAKIPNGAPGIQNRLHMVWTQGVETGKITKQRFVELVAANPAKNCGLYPKKGAIAPGSDADIVIFDPSVEDTVKFEDMYEGTDYAAFEGFPKKGICDKVYLRGQLMADKEKIVGEKGTGQYIEPQPYTQFYDYFEKKELA